MDDLYRRHLLKLGLGLLFSPLTAQAASLLKNLVPASGFDSGSIKGFVLGRVNNKDTDYFSSLATTNARFGRIFFSFTKCRGCDRYGFSYETREQVKNVLELARIYNIRLVMVGEFPGTELPDFWKNKSLHASFIENWQLFAKTFGHDPNIVGLDLMNEPNPPWPSGNLAEAQAYWNSLAGRTIEAIRGVGIHIPIIYESVAGGSSFGFRGLTPLKDNNVVYSIHHYSPHDITHQRVNNSWMRTIPYPAGKEWGLGRWDAELGVTAWDRQRMELDLRDVISFQRKYRVPIYVGEFSCVRWAPHGSRERYLADSLYIFNKYGWSWTYHEYRGWPGWDAEIVSDDPEVTVRSANSPAMNLLQQNLESLAS